jgi:hypothetical protein
MKIKYLITIILLLMISNSYGLMYNISNATSLFVPNYRGDSNTSYFEWYEYDFYGFPVPPTASRILNNPTPSVGLTQNVQFFQNDRFSATPTIIGSSSGNIYTGFGAIGKQAFATLVVPTFPSIGLGNTTILIQGRTVPESGFAPAEQLILNYPRFTINGINPQEFNIDINKNREGQWYAFFNLNSSNSSYTFNVEFLGGNGTYPISLANMSVDSLWQPIPEPSTYILLLLALIYIFISILKKNFFKI